MAKKKVEKVVRIACEGADTLPLEDFCEFQGELKFLSDENAARLRRVILRDGFSEPVSVWRDDGHNYILNGHQRVRVLRSMVGEGFSVAPLPVSWIEADSYEQAKLKVLDLTSQYGEISIEGLTGFLDEIDIDFPELDASFRFPEIDLSEFDISPPPVDDSEAAAGLIDRAEELQKKWKVKRGQIWEISGKAGAHRVMCGDSTDETTRNELCRQIEVALLSDPPYGIDVDTSWLSALHVKRGKPPNKSDDKLIGDNGMLDLSWVSSYKKWLLFGFPHVCRDWAYSGLLVWDKRGDGGEGGLGNPVEVAAANAFNGYRLRRHVWAGYVREAGEKREPHPTQKPVGIMVDAIRLIQSAVVFDPFLGSGTTIIAAEEEGHICYGCDIEPKYIAVTLQRLTALGLEPHLVEQ